MAHFYEKPKKPSTSKEHARWVLLGAGDHSGIYESRESLPIVPQGPNCPFVPLVIMATSRSLAATFAKLIPHFNMLVGIDQDNLLKTIDIMESKSTIFKTIMNTDRPMYALRVGRNNS
ncbi:hypothetical protein NM688_g7916 [Phlebia brevispora]|uniref:Uncharacterized protein n=1 Tax=Phlebia brevispora TaxID=194682 RepID=A0ACC1RZL6_9APHY|nr:hypothetical protein NM688_g7916 [Phlebia brevispora]